MRLGSLLRRGDAITKQSAFRPTPKFASPAISVLEDAFAEGKRRQPPGNVNKTGSIDAVIEACGRAKALLHGAQSNSDIERAVAELGYSHHVAILLNLKENQVVAITQLAMAHGRYMSPDTDLSKDLAAQYLIEASNYYVRTGNYRLAAIERTNAATIVLEKTQIKESDLSSSKGWLDFSLVHKKPGGVDWAYTEFTYGMHYCNRRASTVDTQIANLVRALDCATRAMVVFEEEKETVSVNSVSQYGTVQIKLVEARADSRLRDAVIENIDDIAFVLQDRAREDPLSVAGLIASNPASIGLSQTPEWFDTVAKQQLSPDELVELSRTKGLITNALTENQPLSDFSALQTARWWEARIDWLVEKTDSNYSSLLAILDLDSTDFDPEERFKRALFLSYEGRQIGIRPSLRLLSATAEAFQRVVDHRHVARLEGFLQARPGQIRFVACSFCELYEWDKAIEVLENSRIVLNSRLISATSSHSKTGSQQRVSPSWVYVTHSPEATFVIVKRKDSPATGAAISNLNGAELVRLTHSFAYESIGLLHSQLPGMSGHMTPAIESAVAAMTPVLEQIEKMAVADQGICLIASGLYASLPISALLAQRKAARTIDFITTVPSRKHVTDMRHEHQWSTDTQLTILASPNPLNETPLQYPSEESGGINSAFSEIGIQGQMVPSARVKDMIHAIPRADMLHFSGHSGSDSDPRRSRLFFQDGDLSVTQILEDLRTSTMSLVTLSSCQSAQASTYILGDEFLGVQTAILYCGCKIAIGTMWPVEDFAAAVLMCRFYSNLSREGSLTVSTVSNALRDAQTWVRTSTLTDVRAFMKLRFKNDSLPAVLVNKPETIIPLEHPKHWAAFHMTSRTL